MFFPRSIAAVRLMFRASTLRYFSLIIKKNRKNLFCNEKITIFAP